MVLDDPCDDVNESLLKWIKNDGKTTRSNSNNYSTNNNSNRNRSDVWTIDENLLLLRKHLDVSRLKIMK